MVLTAPSRTYCCLGETDGAATGVTLAGSLQTEQAAYKQLLKYKILIKKKETSIIDYATAVRNDI